jgi:hypothetical protein
MPRVTITVPDKKAQPYRFALDRKSVSLGRGSENDIVIDCGSVSVRHAVMERVKGGYELRDLGSTNGTKLDGKARDLVELRDGLSVKLGDVAFDFTLTPDEQLTLGGELPGEPPIIKEDEIDDGPPARGRRPVASPPRPLASASQPSAGASFGMTLLFLLLAAAAFFVGMSLRHQKETGRSLVQDIREGAPAVEAPAADAGEEAPAE